MVIKKKVPFSTSLKKYLFVFSFLAISLTNFAIFWLYINFDTIRLTLFTFKPATQTYQWNNFRNYTELIKYTFSPEYRKPEMWLAFVNTFRALIINLAIFPLALIVAYAFYKRIPGTKAFRVIFYLPSIISIVILAMAYKAMFRAGTGPIWQFFANFGYTPEWLSATPDSKTIWPCIYFFSIVNGMGTNVILMASAMQRIPNEVSEASRLDGCGFFRELFSVTVPCIMPTITSWMTMIFTSVFGFYLQPMLIGTDPVDGKTMTIPWQIFNAAAAGSSNMNTLIGAATSGIFLSLFMLPFVLIMRYVMNKLTPEVTY